MTQDGDSTPDIKAEHRTILLILSICNFVIGMGAFSLIGMLEPIANGLDAPVTSVGALMTAYAISYAISAPVLVAVTGRIGRRRVLTFGLVVFLIASLLSTLAPGMALLAPARVLAAAGAGMVTPVTLAIAAALAPPDQRGRALSFVFLGMTLAQVAGVPVGGWLAYTFGWRVTFALVTLMTLPCIWLVWTRVPAGLKFPPVSLYDLARVLKDLRSLITLSFTVIFLGAIYVVYTYLPAILSSTMGYGRDGISLALLVFGAGAPLGNMIGGVMADRLGPARSLALICAAQMLCLPVFALLPVADAVLLGFIFAWSLVGWAFSPSQQVRLVSLAPDLAPVLMSLHAASIYIGVAAGSGLGGATLAMAGLSSLGPVAGGVALLALLLLFLSERSRTRTTAGD